MDRTKFVAEVIEYRASEERRIRGLSLTEAREIAPGVIIMHEADGRDREFLIIFDGEWWTFQHPKPSCKCTSPRTIPMSALRVFRCLGGFPPARDFRAAVEYAKSHLKAKDESGLVWHQLAIDVVLAA